MKKIIASALGLMMVGGVAASASAVENQFGGYWRTRMFIQDEMKQDGEDFSRIDNRTRLYYTAKFSEDFKFVNKFEFNSIWGDDNGGDLGADGDTFKVKNSYADFTLGNVRTKLGIMGAAIARGFLFDNDFSGAMVTANLGGVSVTPFYIAVADEDYSDDNIDASVFGVTAAIDAGAAAITPYVVAMTADAGVDDDGVATGDVDAYWVGTDVDVKMDNVSVWGTLIYGDWEEMGEDGSDFLVAVGADAGIAHGQAFYAGEEFGGVPSGASYYWSEIMGLGTFDNTASAGAPGDYISNVYAVNAGVTLKPAEKLKVDLDVWYASLVEEDADGNDALGIEFDGKLTYAMMDNLKAELVLAYLIADDATGDEDVLEAGVRVSLSF